jgi:hypothetical protein
VTPTQPRKTAAEAEADLMMAKLVEDMRQLSAIKSLEGKLARKAVLIDGYRDWIAGLTADPEKLPSGQRNDLLTTITLWALDIGDYQLGIPLAQIVIDRAIPLPDRFTRTAAAVILETVAESALIAARDDKPFDSTALLLALDMTEGADMHDVIRAKAHRAAAELTERAADNDPEGLRAAAAQAQRALELDQKSGAKTLLRDINRKLEKLPPEKGAAASG